MSERVDIRRVSTTLQHLLSNSGRRIIYDFRRERETKDVSVESASAANAFLPAFLAAGDAVWREATGKPLGVSIVLDTGSVLGYTVASVRGASFATVMLAIMEAIEQIARPDLLVLNDLGHVWAAAELRMRSLASAAKPASS